MTEQNLKLLTDAQYGRAAYNMGEITREEMKKLVMPFINNYNKIAEEKAAKYTFVKARKLSLASYLRSNF